MIRRALSEVGPAIFLAMYGWFRLLRRLAGWPDEATEPEIIG